MHLAFILNVHKTICPLLWKKQRKKRQRVKIKNLFYWLNNTPGGPFMDSDVPSSSPVPSEERPYDSTCIKVHFFCLDTIFYSSIQQPGTTDSETAHRRFANPSAPPCHRRISWAPYGSVGDTARGQINTPSAQLPTALNTTERKKDEAPRWKWERADRREAAKKRETEPGKLERTGLGRDQRSNNQRSRVKRKRWNSSKTLSVQAEDRGCVKREKAAGRQYGRKEKPWWKSFASVFYRFCVRERKKKHFSTLSCLSIQPQASLCQSVSVVK